MRRRFSGGGVKTCLVTLNVTNATDATIKLNSTSVTSSSNTIEVNKGDTVTWSVTRSNCVSQRGSITANEDTTKSVTLKGSYTVNSNQGTPDVYFDGVKVGTISNGTLKVTSMDWESAGYTVTLKNYTTKASKYKAVDVTVVIPVITVFSGVNVDTNTYIYATRMESDKVCDIIFYYDKTTYTPIISGNCTGTINLNYNTTTNRLNTTNIKFISVSGINAEVIYNTQTVGSINYSVTHGGVVTDGGTIIHTRDYYPTNFTVSGEGTFTVSTTVDGVFLQYSADQDHSLFYVKHSVPG